MHGTRVISDGYRSQEIGASVTIDKINVLLGTKYTEKDILVGFYEVVDALEKGIELPLEKNNHGTTKTKQDEGTDRAGDEDATGNAKYIDKSGNDIPSSAPKRGAKASAGRKAGSKASGNGSESDSK